MKPTALAIALAILLSFPCLGKAESERDYSIRFQIFRVQDNLSGDTSLTEDIWPGGKEPSVDLRKALTWFTVARLTIGSEPLVVDNQEWSWRGKPLDWGRADVETTGTARPPIILIAAPSIKVHDGAQSSLRLVSETPFEYFEKTAEGLYALKREDVETGFQIDCAPRRKGDRVLLSDLTVRLLSVGQREPVEGVTALQVGRPVQEDLKVETPVRLRPGRDYGMLLSPGKGQGLLLIRIRVDEAVAKEDESG